MEENGVNDEYVAFPNKGIKYIIRYFTSEAGLRNLERKIASLCRKVAHRIAVGKKSKLHMANETIADLLGPPLFTKEERRTVDEVGVAVGLAWTAVGGEILHIEATHMKGDGLTLTLTGQLGDVMKESAQTAIGYIRSRAPFFGINESSFSNNEIHIHLPSGSTPKDGPSAGITLATAIMSLFTNLPIDSKVAMTGEITLTGKVLGVGGLKDKSLAALRMDIDTIIIPAKNEKDLIEIPKELREKINFIPVKTVEEVFDIALVGWNERKKAISKKKKKMRVVSKSSKGSSDKEDIVA